ncbi:MAG: Ig-like domain-containing protein [Candidatus Nanopelagicaceae bacterium]
MNTNTTTHRSTDDFNDQFAEEASALSPSGGLWQTNPDSNVMGYINNDSALEPAEDIVNGFDNQTSALIGNYAQAEKSATGRTLVLIDEASMEASQLADWMNGEKDYVLTGRGDSGLEQIKEALATSQYLRIEVIPGVRGNGDLYLGLDKIDASFGISGAELEVIGTTLSGNQNGVLIERAGEVVISKTDQTDYQRILRETLDQAVKQIDLEDALKEVYGVDALKAVSERINRFLLGQEGVTIKGADFQDQQIRGCYLASSNEILISSSLNGETDSLKAVLIEEFGHWLESGQLDSEGDEGARLATLFAAELGLENTSIRIQENDHALLLVDGQWQSAELCRVSNQAQTTTNGNPLELVVDEGKSLEILRTSLLANVQDSAEYTFEKVVYDEKLASVIAAAEGRWVFQVKPESVGIATEITVEYIFADCNGNQIEVPVLITINSINDPPQRLKGPESAYVIEDGSMSSIGLEQVVWSAGAKKSTDSGEWTAIDHEEDQSLTVTFRDIPLAKEGSFALIDADGNRREFNKDSTYSIADLKELHFQPVKNFTGDCTFTYIVSDGNGGTSEQTFTIHVLANNEIPSLSSSTDRWADAEEIYTEIPAIRITESNLGQFLIPDVSGPRGTYSAVRLKDFADSTAWQRIRNDLLPFNDGDIEGEQKLELKILSLPGSTFGSLFLEEETGSSKALKIGDTMTVADLDRLLIKPEPGFVDLDFEESFQNLTFEVSDSSDTIEQEGGSKAISVSIPIAFIRNTSGKLLAEIGGVGSIEGQDIHYVATSTPIAFSEVVEPGATLIHTHYLPATLSGRIYEGSQFTTTGQAGFSISSDGEWEFQPDLYYARLPTNEQTTLNNKLRAGETSVVEIEYRYRDTSGAINDSSRLRFELRYLSVADAEEASTQPLLVAELINGKDISSTADYSQWIKATEEDPSRDRFFKYISESTLEAYGAIAIVDENQKPVFDDSGNQLYTWPGEVKTANGNPLTTLSGEVITKAGYYDFMRQTDDGDGVEFIYHTATINGVEQQLIIGMNFRVTDNLFGDNDAAEGNIIDPGAPVQILPQLDQIVINETFTYVLVDSPEKAQVLNRRIEDSSMRASELRRNNPSQLALSEPIESEIAAMNITEVKMVTNAPRATVEVEPSDYSLKQWLKQILNTPDRPKEVEPEAPDTVVTKGRAYGFTLPSQKPEIDQLSSAESVIKQFTHANVLGLNLLDSMIIGLSCLYLLYGKRVLKPVSVDRLFGSGIKSAEKKAIVVFQYKDNNKNTILCCMSIQGNRLELLSSQALAGDEIRGAETLEFSSRMEQHIKDLSPALLLFGEGLSYEAESAIRAAANETGLRSERMNSTSLTAAVAGLSDEQIRRLQKHYENESEIKQTHPLLHEQLRLRQLHYRDQLNDEQSGVVAMLELALALAQVKTV